VRNRWFGAVSDHQLEAGGHADRDLSREALRAATLSGLRWVTVARMVVELMLMASMVLLARIIPPAAFGPYAVAVVVQELAIGIQEQGIGSALVQRVTVRRDHLQAGQALGILSGVMLAVLIYIVARVAVKPLFGAPTASLIALSSPLFIIYALGIVPAATLRRELAFRRLSLIDLLNSGVRIAISVGLALGGLGAKSLVYGSIAAGAATSFALWASAPPPVPLLRRRAVRDILGYGTSASLASISWTGFRNCDYVIIGARLGTLQAGLYFRAYNLAVEYQKKISAVMSTVAFPVLARIGTPDELEQLRGQMVRLLAVVLFPLLTIMSIVAPVLIPWLLGHAWAPAVVPTQILAMGGAVTLMMDTAGVVLMASGRSRAMLGFGVGHFLAYATVVWFVSPYGISAVAIGAAVVHTAFLFVSYTVMLWGSPDRPVRMILSEATPAVVSSLAMAAVAVPESIALSAVHTPAFAQLVLVGIPATAAYLLTLRLVFPSAWQEMCGNLGRILRLDRLPRFRRRASASLGVTNPNSSAQPCGASTFCREVPDVAADADPETGYAVFSTSGGNPSWGVTGGTSAAAPLWAAAALANASGTCRGLPIGFANPSLYQIAATSYLNNFRDITTASPISREGNNDALSQFNISSNPNDLFPIATGYDMATGLGSMIAPHLAATLCSLRAPVYKVSVPHPGNQTTVVKQGVALQISATDSGGASLSYSATGLPPGLAINPGNGLISGTPTVPGNYTVTATATDGFTNSNRTSFNWAIITPQPPTFAGGSLGNVAKGKAKLSFKLTVGTFEPPIKSFSVSLPSGLSFAKTAKTLGKHIVLNGANGMRAKYSLKLSHGVLTVTLKSSQNQLSFSIAPPATLVSGSLAGEVKHRQVKRLSVVVKVVNSSGATTKLTLKLKV
jgi:O-antigen/teichoic acid export membrane protein